MAKMLTLEEMLLALKEYDSKKHDNYKFCIEMVAQKLANDLAEHTGTEAGNAEIWDGGLMCGFAPFSHTQDLPGVLDPFDPEGEWVPREPKVGDLVKTMVPLHIGGAFRPAGKIGRFVRAVETKGAPSMQYEIEFQHPYALALLCFTEFERA